MECMKGTKTVSLFAAFCFALAALVTFVSPIVDVDCGTNPSHIVMNIGEEVDPLATGESITQYNTSSYQSTSKQSSDPCDQNKEGRHVHGVHSHVAVSPASAAIDFGSPSLIALPSVLQLAEHNTHPPVKPPRIAI